MAVPTRAKKELGELLLHLRNRAGLMQEDIAKHTKQDPSNVGRYEKATVQPQWPTVLVLLNLYGASEEEIAQASTLFDRAKDEPKPLRLPSTTPKAFRRLVNEERTADGIRSVQPYFMPGLFQTAAYARGLVERGLDFGDPRSTSDTLSVRLVRQERLKESHESPLKVHAILGEAVVRNRIGGVDIMNAQLEYLLSLSSRDHITIQVLPFTAGFSGDRCYIVDADDYPSLVYLEYQLGGAWLEDPKDVQRFTTMHKDAVRAALSPDETVDFIQHLIE